MSVVTFVKNNSDIKLETTGAFGDAQRLSYNKCIAAAFEYVQSKKSMNS